MGTYLLVTATLIAMFGLNMRFKSMTKRLEAQLAVETPASGVGANHLHPAHSADRPSSQTSQPSTSPTEH